ncbi:hypothetical protein SELMODRAFT_426446 [Selaginella moellendorffii]|uniref:Magnesium transporter n=1 Tax=Selaginella moellendorffii TaxID=88036 RepID=D8SWD8_SELML|nr:hypothetical protein SELMODRAFT_426446 [Selaginella moellendorffii]
MDSKLWCALAVDKHEFLQLERASIIQRTGIHARDLRILDPLLSNPSTILIRERAIVLNLEHIKAIITRNEVLVRNPNNVDVVPVIEELRQRLKENEFEIEALKVALESINKFLGAQVEELEIHGFSALDDLLAKINRYNLKRVRTLKGGVAGLVARLQKVANKVNGELEDLLKEDDDNYFFPGAHEEVLEWHFMQVEGMITKLKTLSEHVIDTEKHIKIQIVNRRNGLIQIGLILNACVLAMSFFSMIASFFGMNLVPKRWQICCHPEFFNLEAWTFDLQKKEFT